MKPLAPSLLSLALVAVSTSSQAQTFNFANDFSITNGNPNGVWSYGYTATLGGTFTPHAATQTIGSEIFWRSDVESSTLPATWKNLASTPGTGGLLPGEAALHPGPGAGKFAVARFTSPNATGTVQIDGAFGAGDFGLVSVSVLKNGAVLFSELNTSDTEAFSITTTLAATDTIDFVVDNAGIINGDTTPLAATIVLTPVPEPATLAALGLGALAFLRRRR